MSAYQIVYYTHGHSNPVQEFIDSLNYRQQVKVLRTFQTVKFYGLAVVEHHTRKLSGTPLWELRYLGRDNIRIMYIVPIATTVLLLHGFMKKSTKTPTKEITIALARYKDWLSRI